jgi:hypothetical protein
VPGLISLYHRKKGSKRMDTHYYLCDLLVSRLLIFDSWLNSTWSPVFILQPLPHFRRRWTVGSRGTGWVIPSVSAALLLTRRYSRGGGRWWCCCSCYWHSLRFCFIWYFCFHANRFCSLGLGLVTTDKKNMCYNSIYQWIKSTISFWVKDKVTFLYFWSYKWSSYI